MLFFAEARRNLENNVHAYDVFVGVDHTEHVASDAFGRLKSVASSLSRLYPRMRTGRDSKQLETETEFDSEVSREVALLNSVGRLFHQPARALRSQSRSSQPEVASTSSIAELGEHPEVAATSSVTALQVFPH